MDLLIDTEYSVLAVCLEDKSKYNISESFAFITAFRITRIHKMQPRGDGERAVAASGSNQSAGILEHHNYIVYYRILYG